MSFHWFDRFRQDTSYGIRVLRKSPAFTFVAVASLAIGIGANTGTFTLVNAVMFRAIPLTDASRLLVAGTLDPAFKKTLIGWDGMSLANFADIQAQADLFSGLAASARQRVEWKDQESTQRLSGEMVTSNYFDVLGVKPVLGRSFLPDDDPTHGANAVVLSYELWMDRFAGDPSVVGRQLTLNSVQFSVVGIAPKNFKGTQVIAFADQYWTSIGTATSFSPELTANRRDQAWAVFGRLKSGATEKQAAAQIQSIWERLARAFPAENGGLKIRIATSQEYAHNSFSGALLPVFAAMLTMIVSLIQAIVCINLANVQLARASYRQREVSIRLAMGGSRGRIVSQLVTESLILSTAGGGASLFVMYWIVAFFRPLIRANLGALDLQLDGRVLLFALAVSILSGILFGLAPAIKVSTPDIRSMLHSGGNGASSNWHRNRLSQLLVVSQITFSVIMLVCAGLFIRLLQKAEALDPGYDYRNVASAPVDLSKARYSTEAGKQYYKDAIERLQGLAGIEAAVVEGSSHRQAVFTEQREHDPDYQPLSVAANSVSLNFYSDFRIRMLSGRSFSEAGNDGIPMAIVTHSLAEHLWPGQDPIGKRFHFGGQTIMREVIGVLPDPSYAQVVPLAVVTPMEQEYEPLAAIRIRTTDDPLNHASELRDTVHGIDAGMAIPAIELMRDRIKQETIVVAIAGAPMHLAALLALALSVIGLYGVTAYSLAQRTREIGIRVALGAERRQIVFMILSDGVRLVLAGAVIGIVLARAVAPVFSNSLPLTINLKDPVVYAGAAIVLVAVALIACYVPARRATRVDPLVALRHE